MKDNCISNESLEAMSASRQKQLFAKLFDKQQQFGEELEEQEAKQKKLDKKMKKLIKYIENTPIQTLPIERNTQQLRPCIYNNGADGDVHALLHFIYPKSWTHGAGITIGSASAGQETHAYAVIELEDGTIIDVPIRRIRILNYGEFDEYCWKELKN
jgi:hypothetical protein